MVPMLFLLLVALLSASASTAAPTPSNAPVVIDMVQNNPGDAVAWQQSKYFDPRTLKAHGYTAQTTTGEMSGTQAVDFSSIANPPGGKPFFPAGSKQRMWLDAYRRGVDSFVRRATAAGVKAYFFVDLLVFPTPVLEAYKDEIMAGDGKTIVWNAKTRSLLQVRAVVGAVGGDCVCMVCGVTR